MRNPNSIKIALGSDLHLGTRDSARRRRALAFSEEADVIVLAGDLGVGMHAASIVWEVAESFPSAQIVWVAGNHEFYGHHIDQQIQRYRDACEGDDRIHFLENDSVEIQGCTFLGSTLWTDFSILGEPELAMSEAGRMINDFVCIEMGAGALITPSYIANKFKTSYAYLDENLANSDPDRTIVVSHFPPGLETRNPNFGLGPLTAYFQANVEYLLECYQPALWIYGHNHYSRDFIKGRTRVVSSQLGYPSEDGRIPKYDPKKIVLLSAGGKSGAGG